jgi:hypothetical protein
VFKSAQALAFKGMQAQQHTKLASSNTACLPRVQATVRITNAAAPHMTAAEHYSLKYAAMNGVQVAVAAFCCGKVFATPIAKVLPAHGAGYVVAAAILPVTRAATATSICVLELPGLAVLVGCHEAFVPCRDNSMKVQEDAHPESWPVHVRY